jgi:DNA helicase HerA-like ATPase
MKADTKENFVDTIKSGYESKGDSMVYGVGMQGGVVEKEAIVRIPLATLNRHGLVAGATGTGKTKSLQKLTELLSEKGVPSLVMDIKGDFSGVSQEGEYSDKVKTREENTGIKWSAEAYPTEFLSLSDDGAIRMRSTVSEFGPVLFSKMLELNDTQSSVVSLVFKYCDDKGLPLLDLNDFRKVLQYIQTDEGKGDIEKEFGMVAGTSIGTIMRKVIELEEQGGELLFGEPSFDVEDLVATRDGMGVINVIRLMNIRDVSKIPRAG